MTRFYSSLSYGIGLTIFLLSSTASGFGNRYIDYTDVSLHYACAVSDKEVNVNSGNSTCEETIDASIPASPVFKGITTDTGISPSDGVTNDQTLIFVGTSEANTTVTFTRTGIGIIGTASVNSSGNWIFNYTATTLPPGIHTFTATAKDGAGNTSDASSAFTVKIDITAPLKPVFTGMTNDTGEDTSDGITNDKTLIITGTAEANTTVIIARSDQGVTGKALTNGEGNWSYDYTATSLASGDYTFIATAIDSAGNMSAASFDFNVIIDSARPILTISSSSIGGNPTKNNPIPVNIDFSENVKGFVEASIVITGGTKSNFNGSGLNYSVDIIPSGNGTITIDIAEGLVQDIAGNYNLEAKQFKIKYDDIAPTVSIISTSASLTKDNPIPIEINFNEDVTGFDINDITIEGGAAGNFAGNGSSYIIDVIPFANGTITIDIPSGVAKDMAGNNNTTAEQLSIDYDDTPPKVAISSPIVSPTNNTLIPVKIDFNEDVTGFELTDVIVHGGTKSNFKGSGSSYSFDAMPTDEWLLTVDVAANVAQDGAGNNNSPASQFSIAYTPCIVPVIALSPPHRAICSGGSTSFAVVAKGTELQYQWQINAGTGYVDLINNEIYTGVNTPTLTVTGVSLNMNSLLFRCFVSGICGQSVTSEDAILEVNQLSILIPDVVNICPGGSTTLTADYAASYNWSNGETTSSITVSPTITTTYTVTARTAGNCISLMTTTVKVNPLPTVSFSLEGNDTICESITDFILPEGTPAGGTYSGEGVNDNIFNAKIAGPGFHSITYSFKDSIGCSGSTSTAVFVKECLDTNPVADRIILHPNPTTDKFVIAFDGVYDITVEIISQLGQKVIVKSATADWIDISLKDLGPGVYYVLIWKGDKLIKKSKIVKN